MIAASATTATNLTYDMGQQFSVSFAGSVSNQKCDLYFTGSFEGILEVNVTGGYGAANASGAVIQRFGIFADGIGGFSTNVSRCIESFGSTPSEFAIGPCAWDTANSRYRIQIVHRTTNANTAYLLVRAFAINQTSFNTLAVSTVYTTDTTVWRRTGCSI